MKSLLIQTLESICPDNVYLQGTLAPEIDYPDSFITFWTTNTDDVAHYDDKRHSIEWDFYVYYYSNDPDKVGTVPAQIESALQAVGFIPQGRGRDIASDVITHTGWVQEFLFIEIAD